MVGCIQNTDKDVRAIRDSSFSFNTLSSICIIKQSGCNIKECHLGRDLSEITPSPIHATGYCFTHIGLDVVNPKNSFDDAHHCYLVNYRANIVICRHYLGVCNVSETYFCSSTVKGSTHCRFVFPSLIFPEHTFSENFHLLLSLNTILYFS